jgi:hypothetical protein
MYKGVEEQPRTGQRNNLDGKHITCTYTVSSSERVVRVRCCVPASDKVHHRDSPRRARQPQARHHVALRAPINRIFPYGAGKL